MRTDGLPALPILLPAHCACYDRRCSTLFSPSAPPCPAPPCRACPPPAPMHRDRPAASPLSARLDSSAAVLATRLEILRRISLSLESFPFADWDLRERDRQNTHTNDARTQHTAHTTQYTHSTHVVVTAQHKHKRQPSGSITAGRPFRFGRRGNLCAGRAPAALERLPGPHQHHGPEHRCVLPDAPGAPLPPTSSTAAPAGTNTGSNARAGDTHLPRPIEVCVKRPWKAAAPEPLTAPLAGCS